VDFKIDWTLRSREDLREIATFIARDNPDAALKLGDLIFKRVDTLQQFPEIGRIVPERDEPNVREIVVGNYRVVISRDPSAKSSGNSSRMAWGKRGTIDISLADSRSAAFPAFMIWQFG
jgi:toxin ParE1/3/4